MSQNNASHPMTTYSLAVTACPLGTPMDDLVFDEVDVVAPAGTTILGVVARAELDARGYAGCRILSILDQSTGQPLVDAWESDVRRHIPNPFDTLPEQDDAAVIAAIAAQYGYTTTHKEDSR